MSDVVQSVLGWMTAEEAFADGFVDRLSNQDMFILDNSIRESTVGQLRGHTIDNKQNIYRTVKALNVQGIIIASFSNMHRVDDEFVKWLIEEGEDFSTLYSFSEVYSGKLVDGRYTNDVTPSGLAKNKQFGIFNTILEIDLADAGLDWGGNWTIEDTCAIIEQRMDFICEEINENAKIFVNIRDICEVMQQAPDRCLKIVEHLAKMPQERRLYGIVFEDSMGEAMYQKVGVWCKAVRAVMDQNGWGSGHLLNHIHNKWDLQTASTLECLANGSTGIWASVCCEGAGIGHASSAVTLTNIVRLGNTKVLEKINCNKFRQAAIDVTQYTTNEPPHPKQVVYGIRAVDIVFGSAGAGDFNLGDFFGEATINRITTLASPEMIVERLTSLFGESPLFTIEVAKKMKMLMLHDLRNLRKEEYHSPMGLAVLFDRCGGELTDAMANVIEKVKIEQPVHERVIADIKQEWDNWDQRDDEKGDDRLQFDSFYHGFLQPYFGCYRCAETKDALKALDMNDDGYVEWKEFMVYIKWALHEYPAMTNADEVLEVAFTKGILPAAQDAKCTNSLFQDDDAVGGM